jgi:glycosyltransferase involved in cell wall biosynthesis
MKVLHVLPYPGVGGTEIATRRVADAVRPFGVESVALLLQPSEEQTDYFEQAGIGCITDVPRPEPSLVRAAPRFLLDSWRIARICRNFDLVHCSDVLAAYYIAVAARLADRPVLCHVRNREKPMTRRREAFIAPTSHFAFVSQETRDQFPIRLAAPRTSVLYDGVALPSRPDPEARAAAVAEVRAEFGLADDAVIAAMFARVNPQKDYETLIAAAARLRETHPTLRFLVVGDKDSVEMNRRHFAHVQEVARAAGVLDRFIFTGFRKDTARLMLAADICVLCTHFEGLPLVLIEAMAAGRPCVATAVDGIPETLTDGVTGLLHEHADAEGLAAAIASLVDGRERAEAMGATARDEAERRFSHDRFARDLITLYAKLAPEGQRWVQPHSASHVPRSY